MPPANKRVTKARTPRPRRATKPNRRFLNSEIFNNSGSSIKSLSSPTTTPPESFTQDVQSTVVNSEKSSPLRAAPPAKSLPDGCGSTKANDKTNRKQNGGRLKNFIRFRFQIDCAVNVNVDELVKFLKSNMKIDGKKNNLAELTIERRNSNVHILSKVMLKKKYLKLLSKQYLRKMQQFDYRIVQKNKRAYKIISKAQKTL